MKSEEDEGYQPETISIYQQSALGVSKANVHVGMVNSRFVDVVDDYILGISVVELLISHTHLDG